MLDHVLKVPKVSILASQWKMNSSSLLNHVMFSYTLLKLMLIQRYLLQYERQGSVQVLLVSKIQCSPKLSAKFRLQNLD